MPTSYTSLLGLALPVTGELSGTWGDTVNDYITQYVDAAAAGTQTISGSQTAVTLTVTNGSSLTQVGSGASGSAQYAVINCTGNPASLLTITAPASSRNYLIINATSTSQSVKIVGAGPTTGVTLVAAESAIVAWNGSDYVKVASSTADGVTTISFGSTGLTPSTATSGAVSVAGTLAVANGGTGTSTAFTAGSVVFAGASGVYSQSNANFFWDNSNTWLGIGTSSPTSKLTVAGAISVNTGAANLNALYLLSGNSGNRIGLSMGRTAQEAYIGIASTSNSIINGDVAGDLDILTTTGNIRFSTNAGASLQATLDTSGNLGLGVTPNTWSLGKALQIGTSGAAALLGYNNNFYLTANAYYDGSWKYSASSAAASRYQAESGVHSWYTAPSGTAGNAITFTQVLGITAAGFTQPLAYADTVSALGNTGTAKTIDLQTANVFTATLTGNCTFTLSNPIATGSSSFTLILTNDGTAGRTVAWSGGSFVFPGGAASLSRTTAANAVDVWVFFTTNGGTTWYGNIAMKDMKA